MIDKNQLERISGNTKKQRQKDYNDIHDADHVNCHDNHTDEENNSNGNNLINQSENAEKCINSAIEMVIAMLKNGNIVYKEKEDNIYCVLLHLYNQVDKALKAISFKAPAVQIEQSIKKKKLQCLFCKKWVVMLKKHIEKYHGMSTRDYKTKFGLSDDYPMVPEEYSVMRKLLAHQLGLGISTKASRMLKAKSNTR